MNLKKPVSILFGAAFLLSLAYGFGRYHAVTATNPLGSSIFQSKGGCTKAIIKEIDNAKSETYLIERYHNDRFKGLMDGFMPQWRQYKEELNRFGLLLEDQLPLHSTFLLQEA